MGLDLVVVSYQTPRDLQACCESLIEAPPETATILHIVNVDPQEEDALVADELARSWSNPVGEAQVIWFDDNVGYARACNAAATLGKHDVIGFLNADTRLLPGVIDSLYVNLMARDDWGIIGPRQVDDRGRITHGGILGTPEAPVQRGWQQPDNPAYCDIREDAVMVMGSAYFIKRSVWDELTECPKYRELVPEATGAFLPTQHYYEETWCSYHARAHGYKNVYWGLAKMVHLWHRASPVGGFADREFPISQKEFRRVCDGYGLPHD